MAANSAIEWTMRTWQLTCGCLLKSAGCLHCYAETMAARLKAMALADIAAGRNPGRKRYYIDAIGDDGRWSGKVVPILEALDDPLRWKKPQTVFVDSMSDLFFGDEWDRKACQAKGIPFEAVPFDFIGAGFGTMAMAPQHTFQVLTKRSGRMAEFFKHAREFAYPVAWACGCRPPEYKPRRADLSAWPLPNVWVGCSAEDQKQAIIRHRDLVDVPAAVRFWSIEPLLGPIDALPLKGIGWVIVGGESGTGARPCDPLWIRDIVQQCREARVPVFVKQLGANVRTPNDEVAEWLDACGHLQQQPTAGRQGAEGRIFGFGDKKGGDMAEWPEDLRVREMPSLTHA